MPPRDELELLVPPVYPPVHEAGDCVMLRASVDLEDQTRFLAVIRGSYFDRAGILWYFVSWLHTRQEKAVARMVVHCEDNHVHIRGERGPLEIRCGLKKALFSLDQHEPVPQPASCIVGNLPFRYPVSATAADLPRASARERFVLFVRRPQEELDDPAAWNKKLQEEAAAGNTGAQESLERLLAESAPAAAALPNSGAADVSSAVASEATSSDPEPDARDTLLPPPPRLQSKRQRTPSSRMMEYLMIK